MQDGDEADDPETADSGDEETVKSVDEGGINDKEDVADDNIPGFGIRGAPTNIAAVA
ncbi:hypothetical protein [Natranaeroarchaeum aerophilus]|uniref:Uncharacterized protein n=1 Tax=Natranaeroarchaeum aerophilus TaxID=2917711 RepID=A0AAE3FTR7_9EURY|nr:hypothetical protein [Natranaeroarchaeum aerophilus]MCL9815184.1 hypothetical protein [Natranaeroarchaeum aerophilus]